MYIQELALNDQQGLICHKTQPINLYVFFFSAIYLSIYAFSYPYLSIYLSIYLNKIIHLRRRIISLQWKIQFLQSCTNNKVVPDYIPRCISKIKCRNTINIERALIKDKIVFYPEYITSLTTCLHTFWKKAWTSLSFFDIFCFSKHLSNTGNNTKNKTLEKNKRFLHFFIKTKFGFVQTSDKYIFHFSSDVFSDC